MNDVELFWIVVPAIIIAEWVSMVLLIHHYEKKEITTDWNKEREYEYQQQ